MAGFDCIMYIAFHMPQMVVISLTIFVNIIIIIIVVVVVVVVVVVAVIIIDRINPQL